MLPSPGGEGVGLCAALGEPNVHEATRIVTSGRILAPRPVTPCSLPVDAWPNSRVAPNREFRHLFNPCDGLPALSRSCWRWDAPDSRAYRSGRLQVHRPLPALC